MKNRFVAVVALLVFAPLCLSAAFLQLGPTYSIDFPIDTEAEKVVDFEALDFTSYHIGLDERINIGYVQLKGDISSTITEDLRVQAFTAGVSAGLRSRLSFLEFILGAGVRANVENVEGSWLYNGGEFKGAEDLFNSSSLFYRASLGINMGRKVTLSLEANAPLDLTVSDLLEPQSRSIAECFTPDLGRTTVSVGLLFKMI